MGDAFTGDCLSLGDADTIVFYQCGAYTGVAYTGDAYTGGTYTGGGSNGLTTSDTLTPI